MTIKTNIPIFTINISFFKLRLFRLIKVYYESSEESCDSHEDSYEFIADPL